MATPVIFVPGIMGSRLELPPGPNWDPADVAAMATWAVMDAEVRARHLSTFLRPTATTLTALLPDADQALQRNVVIRAISQHSSAWSTAALYESRGWGGVVWEFYGALLVSLESSLNIGNAFFVDAKAPVFAFGYDWRQSVSTAAGLLRNKITEVLNAVQGSTQVVLVTHSMGGLVARLAVQDSQTQSAVRAVVHVAQPAHGAVTCYRRFHTGFGWQFEVASPQTWFLQQVFGRAGKAFTSSASGVPSVCELLPSNRYPALAAPWLTISPAQVWADVYEVYLKTSWPGLVDQSRILTSPTWFSTQAHLETSIKGSRSVHSTLGQFCHPVTHCIYGTGVDTDHTVAAGVQSVSVARTADGDGTVESRVADGSTFEASRVKASVGIPGAEHATMFKDIAPGMPSPATIAATASARSLV